jgi:hypothetical protein
MSRSRRGTPVTGITTAVSEKEWKPEANRKLRHAAGRVLQHLPSADPDALVLPVLNEVVNQFSGPKDSQHRFGPRRHPRLMRK